MANLQVSELDFDQIKDSLKNYLRSQPQFTDYDFDGSGLSILLDILAYNTHYNAYYLNMAANEFFLDSAFKKSSAVSIAKHLNYTPRSRRSSKARINMLVNNVVGSPISLTLERFTPFFVNFGGELLQFVNLEPQTITPVGGVYSFEDVEIREGFILTSTFQSTDPGLTEKFIIPNKIIDTDSVRVTVQNSITDFAIETFTKIDDITGITGVYPGYFLELTPDGFYQIFFGDGRIGKKLTAGNIIIVEYLVSKGARGNVSRNIAPNAISFSLGTTVNGYDNVSITTLEVPNGGQNEETIDSIKFNAPRSYTAQNRAVTANDYSAIIKHSVSNIDSIVVWGGEDSVPPVYGKVFISVVPTVGNFITASIKEKIINTILASKKVMSVVPEIVDPDFFYITVESNVKFNTRATNKTSTQIKTDVETRIRDYFATNLSSFNEPFIFSRLSTLIDTTDVSIIGNNTSIKIQKRFRPSLTSYNNFDLYFNNILKHGSIATTRFAYTKDGFTSPVRIKDAPGEATIIRQGTFRRNGTIATIRFSNEHNLIPGETVDLVFSNGVQNGEYEIYEVPDNITITVISVTAGTAAGTVELVSKPRGRLQLYNADTGFILEQNIGFVSYQEGIVSIQNLLASGYLDSMRDIRLTVGVDETSKDINVARNQILLLDDSASIPAVNLNSGLTVSVSSTVI